MALKSKSAHTRAADGTILNRTCFVPIASTVGVLPVTCGDRVFKRGRCLEHYTDARAAAETRRATIRVNPARRAEGALGLSPRQLRKARRAAHQRTIA